MSQPLVACFCDKPIKKLYLKYHISSKEHLQIAEQIGDSGVLLFMHYLRMASLDHPVITDAGVAASLGWTERKARRYRGELTKFGWYKEVRFTRPDGTKMVNYHIGKEAVERIGKSKEVSPFAPAADAPALGPSPERDEIRE